MLDDRVTDLLYKLQQVSQTGYISLFSSVKQEERIPIYSTEIVWEIAN
jgi:hypothetical protein